MDIIAMSQKEINRYGVIRKLLNGEINGSQAAEILRLSTRQTRRLKSKVKKEGAKGIVHGNRGKTGNRKIPKQEEERIISLLHKRYSDFKPGFAAEKLKENHGIKRDPKTIRQIMINEDLWKPKKPKDTEYHAWRQRKPCFGEMQQFDGSYEHWFEDRGSECCLLASIDDATGIVTHAKFDLHEGVVPVFTFWQEYLLKNGKPYSIYVDRFSTYKMCQKVAIENPDTLTQFQRAMRELGIEVITAHSSQAKGRIERLFKTFQDRLIKEFRLKGISTIPEANKCLKRVFLPKFNARFSVEPRSKANLHKELNLKERVSLDSVLSRQHKRVIRNDFTFSFKNRWYQLTQDQPVTVCKADSLTVEERLNGAIQFRLRGKYLNAKPLPERPCKMANKLPWVLAKKTPHIPAPDHPWRHFQFSHKSN